MRGPQNKGGLPDLMGVTQRVLGEAVEKVEARLRLSAGLEFLGAHKQGYGPLRPLAPTFWQAQVLGHSPSSSIRVVGPQSCPFHCPGCLLCWLHHHLCQMGPYLLPTGAFAGFKPHIPLSWTNFSQN